MRPQLEAGSRIETFMKHKCTIAPSGPQAGTDSEKEKNSRLTKLLSASERNRDSGTARALRLIEEIHLLSDAMDEDRRRKGLAA